MHPDIFTSSDITIARHLRGISLSSARTSTQHAITLSELNNLPVCIYFMNQESSMCHVNDNSVILVGRNSVKDVLGKTARDFCRDELGHLCIHNDELVRQSQTTHLFDETGYRADDCLIQQISFKMPWYYEDKLAGSLGISIYIDTNRMHEFTLALTSILNTGIVSLPFNQTALTSRTTNGNHYILTNRELSILHFLAKGYTAKRIGSILKISYRTVENYIARMKIKLDCDTKTDLIALYNQHHD